MVALQLHADSSRVTVPLHDDGYYVHDELHSGKHSDHSPATGSTASSPQLKYTASLHTYSKQLFRHGYSSTGFTVTLRFQHGPTISTVRDHRTHIHTYLFPVLGAEVRVGAVVAQVEADLRAPKSTNPKRARRVLLRNKQTPTFIDKYHIYYIIHPHETPRRKQIIKCLR